MLYYAFHNEMITSYPIDFNLVHFSEDLLMSCSSLSICVYSLYCFPTVERLNVCFYDYFFNAVQQMKREERLAPK